MKKSTSFISAVLAGTMLIPTMANAGYSHDLVIEYQNGTLDLDLDINMDGEVNAVDACAVLHCYSELSTDSKIDYYYDIKKLNALEISPEDITDEKLAAITYEMNDEIRANSVALCEAILDEPRFMAEAGSFILDCIYSDAKMGDVNMDGVVDADDASEILSVYSDRSVGKDIITYTQDQNFKHCADINEDGIVDACDASDVLNIYSETSTS